MLSPERRRSFDELLEDELARLPAPIRARLAEEVPVVVEDRPHRALRRELGLAGAGGELCGLHQGVALTERSLFDDPRLPDEITLFRVPIMRLAGDEAGALREQIRITLLHEIGHFFGLGEEELERLGYG